MQDIKTIVMSASIAAATWGLSATTAVAQDFSYGERLFNESCSACHGPAAEGDGRVGVLFNVKLRSLKSLAKANNGHFPFSEVYQSINGAREIQAHGVEMPVWGSAFRRDAIVNANIPGALGEEIVQGRILALVYYLQSIQE